MNKSALVLLILFWAISSISCDTENAIDCFKKGGEEVEQEIQIDLFSSIVVYDEVDIYLVNSNEQKVIIKAGKNLIPKIHLNVEEEILNITNDNTCNWIRSPENPGIYIYSNDISSIDIFDYANFISEETLKLDKLSIFSDGTGNFEMNIDVDSLFVKSVYISNFALSGRAGFMDIVLTGDSRLIAGNLLAHDIEIDHNGSNRVELYPINSLRGVLRSTGSLYYYHEPEILDVTIKGTGQLINSSE